MSAIVCHVPTIRRLFIAQSQHGMTSPCSALPCSRCSRYRQPARRDGCRATRYTCAADRCALPIAAVTASATAQFAIAP